jgi:hypothetical protein
MYISVLECTCLAHLILPALLVITITVRKTNWEGQTFMEGNGNKLRSTRRNYRKNKRKYNMPFLGQWHEQRQTICRPAAAEMLRKKS